MNKNEIGFLTVHEKEEARGRREWENRDAEGSGWKNHDTEAKRIAQLVLQSSKTQVNLFLNYFQEKKELLVLRSKCSF
jgi:hypothetical protein